MDAINAENTKVTSSGWLDLPKGAAPSLEEEESGPIVTRSPQRRVFIDFSSVKRVKVDAKTVRKIRRRGKVRSHFAPQCVPRSCSGTLILHTFVGNYR